MGWSYLVRDVKAGKFSLFKAAPKDGTDRSQYEVEIGKIDYQNDIFRSSNLELRMQMHESSRPEVQREWIHILDAEFCCQLFDRKKNCLFEEEKNNFNARQGRAGMMYVGTCRRSMAPQGRTEGFEAETEKCDESAPYHT